MVFTALGAVYVYSQYRYCSVSCDETEHASKTIKGQLPHIAPASLSSGSVCLRGLFVPSV